MDKSLLLALTTVMSINVVLFLGQMATDNINPEGNKFFNYSGSMLSQYDGGDYVLNSSPNNQLPTTEGSVSPETGNIFTDPITTAKNWLLESTGLNYLVGIISAPANFLKSLGLPQAFVFSIGALWYAITLLLIIAFIIGR